MAKEFITALIRWNDTKELENVIFEIGKPYNLDDEETFFYCESKAAFDRLCNPDNGEDFVVEKILSVCNH